MKKVIIIVALLLVSSSSFAQKFTLNELIKMNNMNLNDFDTYVTSKGYVFENGNTKMRSYHYNKSKVNGEHFTAERHVYKSETGFIGYHTLHSEEYSSFKNQLKEMHFTFIKTENEPMNNAAIFEYENSDYKVLLTSDKNKDIDNGQDLDGQRYGIKISRK